MPSAGSVATEVLLRMATFTGRHNYAKLAATTLRSMAGLMSRYPTGFGNWLGALDYHLSTPKEIAIVGSSNEENTQALLRTVFATYLPNKVVTGRYSEEPTTDLESPLLQGKTMINNKPTAYVCVQYICKEPVTDTEALVKQLAE